MKLFQNNTKALCVVIIGCSQFGAALAAAFSDNGYAVSVVDKNTASFIKLSPTFTGNTILGDATELCILKKAIRETTAIVIAVTSSDNTNIMISEWIRQAYKEVRVVACLQDIRRKAVYQMFGIETISIDTLLADGMVHFLNPKAGGEAI